MKHAEGKQPCWPDLTVQTQLLGACDTADTLTCKSTTKLAGQDQIFKVNEWHQLEFFEQ